MDDFKTRRLMRTFVTSTACAAGLLAASATGPALGSHISPSSSETGTIGDNALLAELGLTTESIHQTDNTELLWRAVRQFVVTHRVSVASQQAILRRLWKIDLSLAGVDVFDPIGEDNLPNFGVPIANKQD